MVHIIMYVKFVDNIPCFTPKIGTCIKLLNNLEKGDNIMVKVFIIFLSILLISSCSDCKKNYLSEYGRLLKESKNDKAKINDAIQLLKTEYKNNPESKMAAKQLASLYSSNGKNDSALFLITKLIEDDEKDIYELYYGRGNIKFIMKDYDSSIEDYYKAVKIKSDNRILYNQIIIAKMWKDYNINGEWKIKESDISKLINEVYPSNMNKPLADEFKNFYQ